MQLYLEKFESGGATAMLRWCLSRKEIGALKKKIRDDAVKEAWMVISILKLTSDNSFQEECRIFKKVTAMATYISFRNPGPHLILAGIIDDDQKDFLLKKHRQSRAGIDYEYELIAGPNSNSDGVFEISDYRLRQFRFRGGKDFVIKSGLEVEVAKDLFASKPKDYRLINSVFDTAPQDECQHRRRRLIGYPMLLLLLLTLPVRFLFRIGYNVILCQLILGISHVNWRYFCNPFRENIDKGSRHNNWLQYSDGKKKPIWRVLIDWRLIPIYLICGYFAPEIFGFVVWVISWIGVVVKLVLLALGVIVVAIIASFVNETIKDKRLESEMAKREKRKQFAATNYRQQLNDLDCQLVPKEIGISTLPASKKTLELKFQAIKKQVCRPFAGSDD